MEEDPCLIILRNARGRLRDLLNAASQATIAATEDLSNTCEDEGFPYIEAYVQRVTGVENVEELVGIITDCPNDKIKDAVIKYRDCYKKEINLTAALESQIVAISSYVDAVYPHDEEEMDDAEEEEGDVTDADTP